MKELEKLDAGLPYNFYETEVAGRKAEAAKLCRRFNQLPVEDFVGQSKLLK